MLEEKRRDRASGRPRAWGGLAMGRGRGVALGTCTDHARVLLVLAVMLSPARVSAALQRTLRALTVHIVQQDGSGAWAKVAAPEGPERTAAAQKAAHDTGVLDVPVVVTHRAPHSLVPDLNAALAEAASAHQTQGRICGRQESKSGGKDGWVGSYRQTASQVSLVIYNKKINTGMSSLSD